MIITLDGGDRATHLSAWYYCALPANNSPDLTALGPWVEIITWNLIRDSLYSTFNANLLGYNDKNTTGSKTTFKMCSILVIQTETWKRLSKELAGEDSE